MRLESWYALWHTILGWASASYESAGRTNRGWRTVPLPVLGLVSELLPAEFPWHPNWRRAVTHRVYWDLSTTIDHVEAASTGGDWQAALNLVTACARCQYQKGNRNLDDLGWRISRTTSAWDGLTGLLPELFERAGRPARVAAWIAEYGRSDQSQQ